ncbi:unnamed protein product [Adineta ricciae]|uniref:BZIP domain-containing protein n=1 Tax=Adineta ricciae TaxID=249248 RepID=A0A815NZ98_ADIRI|nr:unnamed protein product [Adineta ricciae]
MFSDKSVPSYSTQDSTSSADSNDSEAYMANSNVVEYGPIKIRQIRKPAPTIATGRRPKHLVLVGEEALKRQQRREKNREAAKKLKERRQMIEQELGQKLKELEGEHSTLQSYLQQLQQRKTNLQSEIQNCLNDPIEELLSNHNQDMLSFFEQYLDDPDLYDEDIENMLNFD